MSLFTYAYKKPLIWYASGVIIFNHDFTKTIIVKTPKGNVGFPKGGKEFQELLHQTAHREVEEETGLKPSQYKHDNTLVGEKKGDPNKGTCTIYYFIAHVDEKTEEIPLKCCMPNELSFIEWVPLNDARNMLCKRRSDILEKAYSYIIEKRNNNTLDNDLFKTFKKKNNNSFNYKSKNTSDYDITRVSTNNNLKFKKNNNQINKSNLELLMQNEKIETNKLLDY